MRDLLDSDGSTDLVLTGCDLQPLRVVGKQVVLEFELMGGFRLLHIRVHA